MKIIKINLETKTFETDNGEIFPFIFEVNENMTLEIFQELIDKSENMLKELLN